MRKLVSLIHLSLDGFCAGPKGEMDWITVNPAIFEDADRVIATRGRGRLWPHHLRHDAGLLAHGDQRREGAARPA